MKKKKGMMQEILMSLMVIFTSLFILMVVYGIYKVYLARVQLDDAMASSTLASAVADTKIYGATEILTIQDTTKLTATNGVIRADDNLGFDKAFDRFKTSLKSGLGLDEYMQVPSKSPLLEGGITISEFTIYNVVGNDVYEYRYENNWAEIVHPNGRNILTTPDGSIIVSTTIYSKITFKLRDFFGNLGFLSHDSTGNFLSEADRIKSVDISIDIVKD